MVYHNSGDSGRVCAVSRRPSPFTALTGRPTHSGADFGSINQPPPTWMGLLRPLDRTWNRNVVKSRDVFPHKFSAQWGGEVTQVPGDNLARIGPSRIAVWEVV